MGLIDEPLPDFRALNDLADLYAGLGRPLAPTYPLYGRDAHRTRAGIHADGLNKFWWMYAPFDVPRLLGRPLEVSLTRDSGLAGLVFLDPPAHRPGAAEGRPGAARGCTRP